MKWKWSGPLKGGITQSMLGKFLQDPYCFVLYYGLGLEEPQPLSQNLMWGNMFHKALEHVLPIPSQIKNFTETEKQQLFNILQDEERKYPHINATTLYSVMEMLELYPDEYKRNYAITTEMEFKVQHNTGNHQVSLKGKIDGVGTLYPNPFPEVIPSEPEHILIEHKSKESFDRQLFRSEISLDLQLNQYLYALNRTTACNTVVYDNVRIPELQWNCPARQAGERHKAYISRLYHKPGSYGDYPVKPKHFVWVDQYIFIHPMSQVELFLKETLNPIIDSLCFMYEYTLSDSFDPTNPDCYNYMFHKRPLRLFDPARTSKFKKDYWSHLTGAIPLEGLTPVNQLFKELSDDNQ